MSKIKGLLRKAKRGDREAFSLLMEDCQGMLYRTAMLLLKNEDDVLDAMQETILVCWERLPTLRHDRYFHTWLTRILLNKCYDCLRQRAHFSGEETLPELGTERDLDTGIDVGRVMMQLPEGDRVILSLFYYDDYTTRQIAQSLGISEGAVRTRLTRSRERFKRIYLQEEPDDEKKRCVAKHGRS